MKFKGNTSSKILFVVALVFAGLFAASAIMAIVRHAGIDEHSRGFLLTLSAVQNIVGFILPVVAGTFIMSAQPWSSLRLRGGLSWQAVGIVAVMYLLSLPAMNYIVDWNASVALPGGMSGIEQWMKQAEELAQRMTDTMLGSDRFGTMLVALLVVGILTAVGEELLFRGSLLGICLDRPMNQHLAVIAIAFLFSAIHFQFYGFVPRLLLGIWLGYLMVWTQSVWVPILAHALNNGMVVVMTYLNHKGIADLHAFNALGVDSGSYPAWALASAVATVLFFAVARRALTAETRRKAAAVKP